MNRRRFLKMFGAASIVASTNPVHFLAPLGGWKQEGRIYSLKDTKPLITITNPIGPDQYLYKLFLKDIAWASQIPLYRLLGRSIDLSPGYVEDPDFDCYMESDDTFRKRILELIKKPEVAE